VEFASRALVQTAFCALIATVGCTRDAQSSKRSRKIQATNVRGAEGRLDLLMGDLRKVFLLARMFLILLLLSVILATVSLQLVAVL